MKLQISTLQSAAQKELKYIEDRRTGKIVSLKTPWKKFDKALMDGVEWGSIITIAGMSGSGKTTILNELETGLFQHNPNEEFEVLSFNFEMLARRLVGRKFSKYSQKTVQQLYSADPDNKSYNISKTEYDKLVKFTQEQLSKYPISYVEKSGTSTDIADTIKYYVSRPEFVNSNKGLVVTIDHSILVRAKQSGQTLNDVLYDLGSTINNLKKDHKLIFVIVSQLNRNIEAFERKDNPSGHYPQKSDVFGADALYMYSDMFLITHRPEMLNLQYYGVEQLEVKDAVYWHFLKTRDGDPFIAKMVNDLKNNTIKDPS